MEIALSQKESPLVGMHHLINENTLEISNLFTPWEKSYPTSTQLEHPSVALFK